MRNQPRAVFYRKIVAAKLFIDRHYAKAINVDDIASEACFSKFDFIRKFKKTYGTTPHQYLTETRLRQAAELLKRPNASVQIVCFEVGYESVSTFSGVFRKAHGLSPKQYQQLYRKRTDLIQRQPLNFIPGCFASIGNRSIHNKADA